MIDTQTRYSAVKTSLLCASLLLFISCQRPAVEADSTVEAVFIEHQKMGCRLPVIEFTKGLEQARKLADAKNAYKGYFSVYGLGTTYWQPGRKLVLTIRQATQPTVCDAMGAVYPAVDVVSVR